MARCLLKRFLGLAKESQPFDSLEPNSHPRTRQRHGNPAHRRKQKGDKNILPVAREEVSHVRVIACHSRHCQHAGTCPSNSWSPATPRGRDADPKAQGGNAVELGLTPVSSVSTPQPNQYPVPVFGACKLGPPSEHPAGVGDRPRNKRDLQWAAGW